MAYSSDAYALFVGLELVDDRLAGRAGTFIMKDDGVFDHGVAASSFEIVKDSGTGPAWYPWSRYSRRRRGRHADDHARV